MGGGIQYPDRPKETQDNSNPRSGKMASDGSDIVNYAKNAFQTERLTFQSFEETDEDKAELYAEMSDPVVQALADPGVFQPKSKATSNQTLEGLVKHTLIGVWICLRDSKSEDGSPAAKPTRIGFMVLSKYSQTALFNNRSSSISVVLKAQHQRHGYGTEALNWLIDWAFMHGGVHKLVGQVADYNAGSKATFEKLGFVLDGRLREMVYFKRKFYDCLEFSMLEGDWEKLRGFSPM